MAAVLSAPMLPDAIVRHAFMLDISNFSNQPICILGWRSANDFSLFQYFQVMLPSKSSRSATGTLIHIYETMLNPILVYHQTILSCTCVHVIDSTALLKIRARLALLPENSVGSITAYRFKWQAQASSCLSACKSNEYFIPFLRCLIRYYQFRVDTRLLIFGIKLKPVWKNTHSDVRPVSRKYWAKCSSQQKHYLEPLTGSLQHEIVSAVHRVVTPFIASFENSAVRRVHNRCDDKVVTSFDCLGSKRVNIVKVLLCEQANGAGPREIAVSHCGSLIDPEIVEKQFRYSAVFSIRSAAATLTSAESIRPPRSLFHWHCSSMWK